MNDERGLEKDKGNGVLPCVSGSFNIKDSYTIEEVKKIALAFTRAATPSKYISGIEDRFEQVWRLNFGS